MKALFWKDVRINRLPLIAGLFFLVAPYVLVALVPNTNLSISFWQRVLLRGSPIGFVGVYISMALMGGNIFAAERADRSAEFLAYLPPSKRQILMSKGILLMGTAVIMMIWNLTAVAVGVAMSDIEWAGKFQQFMWTIGTGGALGIAAAGTGWCASTMLSSSGGSVGLGLLVPLVIVFGLNLLNTVTGWPAKAVCSINGGCSDNAGLTIAIFAACTLAGMMSFIVGCVYYLRRVEP